MTEKTEKTQKFIDFVSALVNIPTVTGFEKQNAEKIADIVKKYTGIQFDSQSITPSGSVILEMTCKKPGAKRLVFDAHYDTVGFMVTKHVQNGFVQVTNLGGIDTGILYGAQAELYGKQTIRGFFTSTPPHLSKNESRADISEILIDTGLDDDTLKELCPIGTPAGFYETVLKLANGKIASKSLDDKICVAAAAKALEMLFENRPQNLDVCLHLSCGEEKSMLGGATFAQNLKADAYIVLDVNFAKEQTSRDGEYLEFEKGAGISISSATSHVLTRAIFNSAKKHAHNLQRVVEMTNTGTNANIAGRKCTGTHTAVLSIPLRYMHTSVETVSVEDCFSCAEILRDFAYDCDKEFPCESIYRIKGGEVF